MKLYKLIFKQHDTGGYAWRIVVARNSKPMAGDTGDGYHTFDDMTACCEMVIGGTRFQTIIHQEHPTIEFVDETGEYDQ